VRCSGRPEALEIERRLGPGAGHDGARDLDLEKPVRSTTARLEASLSQERESGAGHVGGELVVGNAGAAHDGVGSRCWARREIESPVQGTSDENLETALQETATWRRRRQRRRRHLRRKKGESRVVDVPFE
jgi:hypothetical protein